MNQADTITGKIIEVRDYGTLVVVDADGRLMPVPFEHRAFQWLLEGEGCSAGDLAGRAVSYDGDTLGFVEDRP